MMSQLNDLLADIENRSDIGAVILTSAVEGVFLTHFDVDEIENAVASTPFPVPISAVRVLTQTESAMDHIPGARALLRKTSLGGIADMNLFHEVTARMRAMNKVFIAAINGRAMGAGCELSLACDLRVIIASDDKGEVLIGQPEILIGLIPGGGGTQLLTRSLGVAKALEHCLEGAPLSPEEALELGMVNHVVPRDELVTFTNQLADRMSRRSAFAVAAIKKAVYQAASHSFDAGMQFEKSAFLASASQNNTRRAMQSYISKIRSLIAEGRQLTLSDFDELIAGKSVDMAD
jgi:enoyl-CoA hydratase/carnithine racemase